MSVSVHSFQSAARLGGDIKLDEKGAGQRLINSNWLGRAVAWLKSSLVGATAKQAQTQASIRTREKFMESLQLSYGATIASEVNQKFGIEASAKPLSARTVRNALAEATKYQDGNRAHNEGLARLYGIYNPTGGRFLAEVIRNIEQERNELIELKDAQPHYLSLLISQKMAKASANHAVRLDDEAAKEIAGKAVKAVIALGPENCKTLLDARATLRQDVRQVATACKEFGSQSQTASSLGPENTKEARQFIASLVQASRAMETVARITGAGDGADGVFDMLDPLVKGALAGMSQKDRNNLRQQLKDENGLAYNFLRGAMMAAVSEDGTDPGALSAMTAHSTMAGHLLKTMLTHAGNPDDLEVLMNAQNLPQPPREDEPPLPPPSRLASAFAEEVSFSFAPKAYNLATVELRDVFSGENRQISRDFGHYAATRNMSAEYRTFINLALAMDQNPSLDHVAQLKGLLNDLNVSGEIRKEFENAFENLNSSSTAEQLRSTFNIIKNVVVTDLQQLVAGFRKEAAEATMHRATLT